MTFVRRFFLPPVAILLLATCFYARADYTAVVNPNSPVVTNFQGWGTSLCWWANVIGSYPNRTNYVNLAFNTLKLNIVRYNIGGGQNPTNTAIPGQGYRALMQGFEPNPGIWNWNADTNQRWVLQQAEARGANYVDAFANSPPWWMCVDSNVWGDAGATNNLQVNNEANFAFYLANVVSNLTVLDGDHFNYLTPMNEPNGSKWTGTSQEGCDMSPSQQGTVVGLLHTQLNTSAPSVGIDAAEDVDPYQTYNDLTTGYTSTELNDVALFTTHTYGFTGASSLQGEAAAKGKPLWVAEHGDSDGTGMTMAREIYNDITVMKLQAWVYWQVVDAAGGWGFLLNSLLATTNASYTPNYTINEKFYVMGQFSEFVRPGCNIISVNDTNTLAAWNSTNGTLTMVMVNNTGSSLNVTYNLSDFGSLLWQGTVTQTDPSENMASLPGLFVTNQNFTAAIPASSVTTFVLSTNVAPTLASPLLAGSTNTVLVYAGEIPTLSVTAQSAAPLYYQWSSNGVAIAGATNSEYTPSNLPSSGTLPFKCIVNNIGGSVTSLWSVAVVPEPFESYPKAVLALQPTGYWPLNESPDNGSGNQGTICHDYIAGNNGVYSNVILAQTGYNTVTEPAEASTLFGTYASPNSAASQIQNLDFSAPNGGNGEFSVCAWVNGYGYSQTANAGIVTKGYFFQEELDLDEGASGADLRFEVRNAAGTAYNANSSINAGSKGWLFLTGVCDEANGNVLLYVNGALAGSASIPVASGITNSSSDPLSIGARATSFTSGNNQQFKGYVADVTIYNYALSASQVQALYAAAEVPLMNVTQSGGNQMINFTGELLSSTNVAGPYAPVPGASPPTYAVPFTNSQMFYRVNNQ